MRGRALSAVWGCVAGMSFAGAVLLGGDSAAEWALRTLLVIIAAVTALFYVLAEL